MKFNELKIGEIFQFKFDTGTRWSYEKLSGDEIKCIQAPFTENSCLQKITILRGPTKFCQVKIIPGC